MPIPESGSTNPKKSTIQRFFGGLTIADFLGGVIPSRRGIGRGGYDIFWQNIVLAK
jgi:hypothetical protein